MNFYGIVSNTIGFIHFIFALLAVLLGTLMLASRKGSKNHKRIGYSYVVVMVIVNATALMIFELYKKWGIFHWSALISLITVAGGFIPMIFKRGNYVALHFSFMFWSVIGLYSAFVAEILVRLPKMVIDEKGEPVTIFYQMVGIGIAVTYFIAVIYFLKLRYKWNKLL